jgi:nucleotide-binding universal stress UspA family protein
MKHILYTIDGSDHGKRAVAVAAAMALRMQAKLSILHISEYVVGCGGVYDTQRLASQRSTSPKPR